MRTWNVIIAVPDAADAASSGRLDGMALRERLLDGWSGAPAPSVTVAPLSSLDPDTVADAADAVILVVDAARGSCGCTGLLTALEEAGRAIIAVTTAPLPARNPYEFAGALVVDAGRDAAMLAAELKALLHRQPHFDRLQRELAIAQRCHGGVEGEIARIHEELQLAAMVQREFLPRNPPSVHDVEFAALWRPAHYVSGDIYDIVRLDDDHVGLFIADAVGHGVPAALMTMVICRSLATALRESEEAVPNPADLLARINEDMIRRQAQTTRFATAAFIAVNCRERTACMSSAGHPPTLLIREDGTTQEIRPEGGLLGIFEGEVYETETFELGVGDRIIMHSDGFEQAFPAESTGDAFEPRLPTNQYLDEFERLARRYGPAEMVSCIAQRLDDHSGSLHQVDDLTMICMRVGALVPAAAA